MKRTLFIILSVLAVFLILGTAMMRLAGPKVGYTFSTISNELPGEPRSFGSGGGAPDVFAPAPAEAPAFDAPGERSSTKNYDDAQSTQTQERLVIQNADLAIVVTDPRASLKQISDLANEYGGFVVSSNMYQSYSPAGKEIPEGSIVIRVPSEKLDEALERIKKGAVDVQSENRSGQDVTSQYVDLQSQLKAKQAAAEKLLEIMDQATRAEDVLNAYVQVQQVQTEIELLKGQIKYLEESAALSAISVRLIAEEGTQPIQVGPWTPEGAAKDAIRNLIVFFQNFVEFLISLVLYILPALILIAVPLYEVYAGGRAIFRRFNRSSSGTAMTISQYVEQSSSEIKLMTSMDDLDQRVKEGERMLVEAESSSMTTWLPLVGSLGIVAAMAAKVATSPIYLIFTAFAFLYFVFCIWRTYTANKQKREIKAKLKEYRDRKAELDATKA